MEEIATIISTRKRREINQEEMENLLCFCEEFLWIDWFDKLIIKQK
ncbi:hypothetical protein LCGC14_2415330 [marine sediment metagenome]|uniref:Uncharacterized protein n=1 Tax=marine sediment metagenome TaxID=412755 RepID=A0A0F9EKN1_9ZZZZ